MDPKQGKVEAQREIAGLIYERDTLRVQLEQVERSRDDLIKVIAQETHGVGISETMTPAERVRMLCAQLDEAKRQVEQLVGDVQAISEDYTEAKREVERLTHGEGVLLKVRDDLLAQAIEHANGRLASRLELSAAHARIEKLRGAMRAASNELGVPQPGYPAPAANAADILNAALAEPSSTTGSES